MERITKFAILLGAGLILGGLVAVGFGSVLSYLSGLTNERSGVGFGSSVVELGYLLIAIPVVAFSMFVAIAVYRTIKGDSERGYGY